MTTPRLPARDKAFYGCVLLFSCLSLAGFRAEAQTASDVLPHRQEILEKGAFVNDYYIANNALEDATWSNATYYAGNQRFYEITGNPAYLTRAVNWATANNWLRSTKAKYNGSVALNDEDADNHCCGQTYIDLYGIDPQSVRITDIVRANDYLVRETRTDYWSWIDTFFMHGPTFAKLTELTADTDYSDKLWAMFNDTKVTQSLFDTAEGLWFRDNKYFYPAKQTSGGNKVFWARGNGWMIAGLCRVIDALPVSDPHRNDYIAMVQTMAAALAPLQQADGFWRSSLYEPTQFDMPETSGTAFYAFAMAWGINNGYLDETTYRPIVAKAWNGMIAEAVHPDGFLGYVQLVAAEPGPSYYTDTKAYGVGAFLLAASELSILADEPAVAADAGPDQTYFDYNGDGNVTVTLDASGTQDPDNKAVTYEWLEGGSPVASGKQADLNLAVGIHDITLRITDNDTNVWQDSVRITINTAASQQAFLETFNNPGGDAPLPNFGWSVLVTEYTSITNYGTQSRAIGVASGDYAFYAPKQDNSTPTWTAAVPNDPAIAYTALPNAIDISSIKSVRWTASGDNVDHEFRVAIQIGGQWYASHPALNDDVPDSGTTFNPLAFEPTSFATTANWRIVNNAIVGSTAPLSLGAAPSADLTGPVTSCGLYLVSGSNDEDGDHVRFDDFAIWTQSTPSFRQPVITSFARVSGNQWELTLDATPVADFQIRSSPDLSFNPGTLINTLTQANPSSDRGVVTGGTNLTTDDTGQAKVRLTLTGHPSDFIRAVPAP